MCINEKKNVSGAPLCHAFHPSVMLCVEKSVLMKNKRKRNISVNDDHSTCI